jgi:hypothetical protein
MQRPLVDLIERSCYAARERIMAISPHLEKHNTESDHHHNFSGRFRNLRRGS